MAGQKEYEVELQFLKDELTLPGMSQPEQRGITPHSYKESMARSVCFITDSGYFISPSDCYGKLIFILYT